MKKKTFAGLQHGVPKCVKSQTFGLLPEFCRQNSPACEACLQTGTGCKHGKQTLPQEKSAAHPLYFINHVEKIKDRTIPFLLEKWGKRITGKTGNVYTLDGGKGRLLSNVEWYSQRDNVGDCAKEVYGYDMCQLTSLAMVMNAMGIKRLHADGQYEDELYNVANLAGYGGSEIWDETLKVYEKILANYPEGYEYKEIYKKSGIVENAKRKIDEGIPVILSMDYKEDWNHGHVIVIVGYTEKKMIVNDPYGYLNSECLE